MMEIGRPELKTKSQLKIHRLRINVLGIGDDD